MKTKIFSLFISGLILLGCKELVNTPVDPGTNTEENLIVAASLDPQGGVLALDSSGFLGQIKNETSMDKVTDSLGHFLYAMDVIRLNDEYTLIKQVSILGSNRGNNYIINTKTGKLIVVNSWPAKGRFRIPVQSNYAFFVSAFDGAIHAVYLPTGKVTVVSAQGAYWSRTASGYGVNGSRIWSARTWLHVDASLNVYAIEYNALDSGIYNIGLGEKYNYTSGSWVPDHVFNQNFFPAMPYAISNEIPGSLAVGMGWVVVDDYNKKLYEVVFSGSNLYVYPYNIANWTRGSLVASLTLSHTVVGTTFLGSRNLLQDSLITDGKSLFVVSSANGSISLQEIAVPSSIPVEKTYHYGSSIQTLSSGGVSNWNYRRGQLYIYNVQQNSISTWDLNPAHNPVVSLNLDPIPFLYFGSY